MTQANKALPRERLMIDVGPCRQNKNNTLDAFKGIIDTLSRETALSELLLLPSKKGSTLIGKNLLPVGANSFLLK